MFIHSEDDDWNSVEKTQPRAGHVCNIVQAKHPKSLWCTSFS